MNLTIDTHKITRRRSRSYPRLRHKPDFSKKSGLSYDAEEYTRDSSIQERTFIMARMLLLLVIIFDRWLTLKLTFMLQVVTELGLKGKRAKFFAPLIKAGEWATLLKMLDLNDPEDAAIQAIVEATLNQQKMQAERQQKLLEIAIEIEKGAVEVWKLERFANKVIVQELSRLPERSIAFLEGKSQSQNPGNSRRNKDIEVKTFVPDEISRQMSKSNSASLTPIHSELTIQEAADLLNVSRSFLIEKIESGELPHHNIGKHRRINFGDLMVYKDRIDLATAKGLDEMVAISQELGLYD
jgi:excisionase family DNA binding protein